MQFALSRYRGRWGEGSSGEPGYDGTLGEHGEIAANLSMYAHGYASLFIPMGSLTAPKLVSSG